MARSFDGSLEELKRLVIDRGVEGEWSDDGQGKFSFRAKSKGMFNWWPESKNRTIQFQGTPKQREELEAPLFDEMPADQENSTSRPLSRTKQIFIVHGHDSEARDQLELALRRLGLDPFVLMNSSGGGKTIIEALEGKIGRDYSSDFGIVLMTPDDVGYASKEGPDKAEPRARQNVILETGMLLSSLTRDRIAFVVKGHLDIPSDLQGIIRFGYNEKIPEIVPKLCQRMKEVGFDLDADAIAQASQ